MITVDYTILIQVAAFLVFWFLLTRLLFKPFIGLLEERERRTGGVKAEAAALKEEGGRLLKEYEYAIAKAKDEGRAMKEGIVQGARQARERLLAQAREEASRMLEAAREEIQKELQKGRELAGREAEAMARQMAEKILGRKVG
ncbi:MAG: ATP synthase F0 subunit B [Deltaproteobacteria bacterium]|nr:ATP synthase F0 subunit B [Deltaproteobacteria bacterium]